jgi:hypothetical protein
MRASPRRLLEIYLNDHLAGSSAGIEVGERALAENRGGRLGEYLSTFIREAREDRAALEQIMDRLELGRSPWKQAAAWVAEKALRAKLNGRIFDYSPLSRLEELEGLCLGVEGKLSLWRTLLERSQVDPRLNTEDLERLIQRAASQKTQLDEHRLEAAAQAFAPGPEMVSGNPVRGPSRPSS